MDIESSYGSYTVVDCMVTQDKVSKVQEWVKKYRAMFNSDPEFHATAAYNAVFMYKIAVGKAGSTDSEAVKKAMMTIKDYKGITNEYTFNDGNRAHQASIIQLNNNDALEVKQIITIE
ncbi:MAG: transporter substrate-binding protein [Firmicutes bacterium]|nr:transporter substrate-binding protein [Bacillota bacterium]